MAFDKKKYDAAFTREKYDTVSIRIPKGRGSELKEYAQLHDKSMRDLILEALWKCYRLDLKTPVNKPEE